MRLCYEDQQVDSVWGYNRCSLWRTNLLCGENENHGDIAYPPFSPLRAKQKSVKYSSFFVFCMNILAFGMRDYLFLEFQHMSHIPHTRCFVQKVPVELISNIEDT
jgi:hypothetical protein